MLDTKRLTFLAASIVATSLSAQDNVGSIVGTVREPGGAPSVRATLVVAGDAILGSRTIVTNEDGTYRINLLPPGNYTVTVSKQGFIGSRASLRVGGGSIMRQDFALRTVAVAGAEVDIVGTSATVDKTETKTSTYFTLDQLSALPMDMNSYSAIALSPGVGGATDYPVVRGGLTGETSFTLNGISLRDSAVRQGRNYENVLPDMTEDISVIQSALNAKYGNNAGGVVAVTTKSGKNYFEGTIRADLDFSVWDTLSNPGGRYTRLGDRRYSAPNVLARNDLSKDYTISIFGPIIPNHLTFSFATVLSPTTYYQSTQTTTHVANSVYRYLPHFAGQDNGGSYLWGATADRAPTFSDTRLSEIYNYKLFWMIGQNHQVELNYNINPFGPYYQGWGGVDFGDYQESDRKFWSVNYRGVIGSSGVIEAKIGKRENDVLFASGPGDPITVRHWRDNANTTSLIDGANANNSTTFLSNGQTGMSVPEVRQVETWGINYNWFNGTHNVDVGVEQMKDITFPSVQYGPNNQRFFLPARRADGMYAVFNYVGSIASQEGNDVNGYGLQNYRSGDAWIPERRTTNWSGVAGDTGSFSSLGYYINDLWTFNDNWSAMGGLRYETYEAVAPDGVGTYVNSSSLSPRFELKYDLNGDNEHLFSFSYAHFRGTLSQGSFTNLFGKYPGNQTYRYFWDKGEGTPDNPEWVPYEEIIRPANYGHLYSMSDTHVQYWVDPDLKPTVAIEYSLSYRRGFDNGGSFRITAVYRDYQDIWNRFGTPTPIITNPVMQTYGGYMQVLKVDSDAKRTYSGLELEWSYPIYISSKQSVHFQGNWTAARTNGTNPWREGNNSHYTGSYWPEIYSMLDIPKELYNPEGEYRFGVHNSVNAWLTWNVGQRGGIRNTFTLLGRYETGGPMEIYATQNFNTANGYA
ncbi:MAG: TonB-dependent receptor, partial [Holophagaceae bacterium]|nr:TonB-dependent receptor [Holophagaceae bacterium]